MTRDWERPLEQANTIRFGRAALKRRIASGELAAGDVIDPLVPLEDREEIERLIANMRVEQLVCAVPRVAAARFARLWASFAGGPVKHGLVFSDLSEQRRIQLAAHLRARLGKAAA